MPEISKSPFRRTQRLKAQIDTFLDKVAEGAMAFEEGVRHYVTHACDDVTVARLEQIKRLEREGDSLRRRIEQSLFTEMLIPDARGDVLGLLDDLDHLLDLVKDRFLGLTIERPAFPEALWPDMTSLVANVVKAVDHTVAASRAYFRNPNDVHEHIHKIGFYESEADAIAVRVRKAIFDSDMHLAEKIYLRDGVRSVDEIADAAEDVGDRLAIYAVKRSL
jgi:predicted phosphate transport protein (TIGR00153 family)